MNKRTGILIGIGAIVVLMLMALLVTPSGEVAAKGRPPTATPTPTPTPTPTSDSGYDGVFDTLVWSDEFDYSGCTASDPCPPDPANWSYDIGYGQNGWGNNELEWYTDSLDNVRVQDGVLIIEARKERVKGQEYTSGRIKTQGKREFTYGRIEARLRLPGGEGIGQGLWPAFWMLGNNFETVGWPDCGETDIMENIGSEPYRHHGALHGPGYSGATPVHGYRDHSSVLAEAFHVYRVDWYPDRMEWYFDGTKWMTWTKADVEAYGPWVFDHPQFIILNLAVGGNWPGSPDENTVFPAYYYIDYVRVYQ